MKLTLALLLAALSVAAFGWRRTDGIAFAPKVDCGRLICASPYKRPSFDNRQIPDPFPNSIQDCWSQWHNNLRCHLSSY
jgi:hypothetical protein